MKVILLIVAVVLWAIAALLAVTTSAIGTLGALDWLCLGAPFFAASFLPIP